jgi:FixJ family two-component response regulator
MKQDVSALWLISIVDDDESIRKSLLCLMTIESLSAKAFASAEDFLDSDDLNDTACLILDVNLPAMSGLELQRHLIAIEKRIPIVFLSATSDERTQARALQAGAVAFLSKPFNVAALLRIINVILRQTHS